MVGHTHSIDVEAMMIVWLEKVFARHNFFTELNPLHGGSVETGFPPVYFGRSLNDAPPGWTQAITVQRMGGRGGIVDIGSVYEYEVMLCVWVAADNQSRRARHHSLWAQASELVDILCEEIATVDANRNFLEIDTTEHHRLVISRFGEDYADDRTYDIYPHLIYIRESAAPRRRPGDQNSRARYDMEVFVTIGYTDIQFEEAEFTYNPGGNP